MEMTFQKQQEVDTITARVRKNMKRWGITVSFLAEQLGVSRQYAWQAVHYRTPLSVEKAAEIERTVDTIIAQRMHMRSFGEQLRAARIASGLTLKQVAEMIGYSWVGVERWEKNICRPKPGVLWHLFMLYGDSSHSMRQEIPSLAANAE
ncbi:MAG: helix-turn-helix domain-containing protein [Bacteroidetes bacterium]|nr:helix-turn-helix domain-containing protein [Bacteroidota bacterium]